MGDSLLVVDDNPLNLKLALVLLEAEGYRVRTASSGRDALAALADFEPRGILLDLQMPEMDGFELARAIRAAPLRRRTLVVAVTACAMPGDERRALEAGCDRYLAKPYSAKDLLALLEEGLGRR